MSENLIERREEDGLVIKTYYDNDAVFADPRDMDNLAVLYCWHPDYILGDEQFGRGDHDSMEDVIEYLRTEREAILIVPLFLLDHSGISIRNGAAIDLAEWARYDEFSTHVGYAYTTVEIVEKLGVPNEPDEIKRQVLGEIEEYDRYLRGEVYGYVIEDDEGTHLDSCWGFLGDDHFDESLKEAVAHAKESRDRERSEADYWRARDVETVAA